MPQTVFGTYLYQKNVSFCLKFRFHQAFPIWPDNPIPMTGYNSCVHPRDMQPNMFLFLNINLMILGL